MYYSSAQCTLNNTSFIGKFELLRRQLMLAHKSDLSNMINPHRWLKHFPNLSRTSQIDKRMSELSRRWKKHANPRKLRESHERWVGNKGTQFPS